MLYFVGYRSKHTNPFFPLSVFLFFLVNANTPDVLYFQFSFFFLFDVSNLKNLFFISFSILLFSIFIITSFLTPCLLDILICFVCHRLYFLSSHSNFLSFSLIQHCCLLTRGTRTPK